MRGLGTQPLLASRALPHVAEERPRGTKRSADHAGGQLTKDKLFQGLSDKGAMDSLLFLSLVFGRVILID